MILRIEIDLDNVSPTTLAEFLTSEAKRIAGKLDDTDDSYTVWGTTVDVVAKCYVVRDGAR